MLNDPYGCSSEPNTLSANHVAVVYRGKCPFNTKLDNAVGAGAEGVVVIDSQYALYGIGGNLTSGEIKARQCNVDCTKSRVLLEVRGTKAG